MSVLKEKRTVSKAEYVNTANQIYVETVGFLTRLSARYSRLIAEGTAQLAGEVMDHTEKANKIYPSDEQRKAQRKAHLLEALASLSALDVRLTHAYGTPVDAVDGFLVHNGRPLCAVTSESAHRYFARNDDGNGKARGALIDAITAKLERKDAGHQMRWDLLWSDPEAQKLRHPDHADYWLWGHAFFEADMADLEHVAGLIGARR